MIRESFRNLSLFIHKVVIFRWHFSVEEIFAGCVIREWARIGLQSRFSG
jgi:hypothetical protein